MSSKHKPTVSIRVDQEIYDKIQYYVDTTKTHSNQTEFVTTALERYIAELESEEPEPLLSARVKELENNAKRYERTLQSIFKSIGDLGMHHLRYLVKNKSEIEENQLLGPEVSRMILSRFIQYFDKNSEMMLDANTVSNLFQSLEPEMYEKMLERLTSSVSRGSEDKYYTDVLTYLEEKERMNANNLSPEAKDKIISQGRDTEPDK